MQWKRTEPGTYSAASGKVHAWVERQPNGNEWGWFARHSKGGSFGGFRTTARDAKDAANHAMTNLNLRYAK
jgi:hypothetical protein